MVSAASPTVALDFGVFDARALAMGGTAVASANGQHAHFYNPALLASYSEEEEDSRNGRVYLPSVVAQVSDSVEDTIDIIDEDLDDALEGTIDALNAIDQGDDIAAFRAQAAAVSAAASDVEDAVQRLGNRDLSVDAFVGMTVSEPANREGGAFYFGFRGVGGGTTNVPQEDLDLLADYIEELDFVAAGGAPQVLHPELYGADGSLIDPSDLAVSSASVASLAMAEWGVALSSEFEVFGQPLALGITPKIMYIEVFVDRLLFTGADLDYSEDAERQVELNADIGAYMPVGDHVRIGLAAKDIVPMKLNAGNGLSVETDPRWRAGLAYERSWVTLGLDYDLVENDPLASETGVQDLSLGAEFRVGSMFQIRAGYREDQSGNRGSVVSGGLGMHFGRFVADLAYASGDKLEGAALQLGWTF
jgi:hypothetical protein